MSYFLLHKIDIFNSFVFLHCTIEGIEKRVSLSFSQSGEELTIHFDNTNNFLQFYKFNNLSLQKFIFQLINKKTISNDFFIEEDTIPF